MTLDELIESSADRKDDYVDTFVEDACDKKDYFSIVRDDNRQVITKFVSMNVDCRPTPNAKAFVMDDVDMYHDFMQLVDKDLDKRNVLVYINDIDSFVSNYFGKKSNKELRDKVNLSNKENHSIQAYKGQNVATDFERSIVVHNLLTLLGIEDNLVVDPENTVNIIKTDSANILFDVANPTTITFDGKDMSFVSVMLLDQETLRDYLNGTKDIEFDSSLIKNLFPTATKVLGPNTTYKGQKSKEIEKE